MASAIMYPQRILKTAQYESHNKVTSLEMKGNLKKYFALEAALMDPNANMVCSPISALFPLGKLALGAEKETAKELLNAIGVTSKIKLQRNLRKLIKSLRNVSGVRLDIASSLYVSKNTRISSNFLSDSEYIFKSGVQKVSFDYPEQTADEINKWISNTTHGIIGSLISPADITPTASMILVNAIYFSGKWENPFETTMDGVFFSPSGHRKVKMIKQYNMYNYVKSNVLKSQIIELPYEGRNASFVIILPHDKQGLPLLLKELKLAPELLDTEMSKMKATNAILVMPKFKMQSEIDLKTLYTKIGVTSIFDSENSGLTKIAKGEKLIVSKAIQKAVIDLNEMGTEASAASALVITKLSLVERLHVEVNCPFLFLVKVNKNALFAGVLNDPEQ